MSNRPKLWTKDFVMVSASNFLLFISFYMLMVTLAMYSIEQFKVSNSIAGLASSIFVLGAVLVRPFAGNLIETIGRKKLLIIGLIIFLLGSVVYFSITSIGWLLFFRFIHGFAFGISTTATGTIVVDVIPPSRRGEGMGYFATSNNLAMAIGPFAGLIILQYLDHRMIFAATTILSIIALITALGMNVPELPKKQKDVGKKKLQMSDFFERLTFPIATFMLIVGIANSSILSFISAYAVEIDLVDAASFFFVMYAIFLLMSRPLTGRLFDLRGENSVMYPSIVLFGVGLILLSQASNTLILLAAGAIIGVGFGTLQSSAQTIAVSQVPHHRVGLATSTFFVFYDLGMGAGPFILGYLIQVTGFRGLYITMAAIAFISLPIYYYLHGRKVREGQSVHL
ncbi:MFS transporter [Oceanobacillus sp. FSL H7-0719]|uniref:MFS transporter n=1 Tax=Oceanobacillus sp. FSL H7-0719 TaxID=2954507 RepID=UPI00324E6CA0